MYFYSFVYEDSNLYFPITTNKMQRFLVSISNNQQMQLYAVNFIPLLSQCLAVSAWHPREQVAVTTYANL